jgi:hypothetical protein
MRNSLLTGSSVGRESPSLMFQAAFFGRALGEEWADGIRATAPSWKMCSIYQHTFFLDFSQNTDIMETQQQRTVKIT